MLLAYRCPEGLRDRHPQEPSSLPAGRRCDRTSLTAAWTLDLEHFDPLALQVFAQPGAVATGTLDPDQHLPAEVADPAREQGVAGEIGGDNDLCE